MFVNLINLAVSPGVKKKGGARVRTSDARPPADIKSDFPTATPTALYAGHAYFTQRTDDTRHTTESFGAAHTYMQTWETGGSGLRPDTHINTHTHRRHARRTHIHPQPHAGRRARLASRLELKKAHGKARTTTSAPHRPHTPHRHAHSPQATSSGCLVTAFMT